MNATVTPLTHHIPNRQLMELIPLSAHTVVEIGCGSGATGQAYLRRNPRAQYIGVEISAEYAAIASQYISRCEVGNIETLDILQLTHGVAPDCIVFGDVLEHLQDPWGLLKRLKRVLAPHGCIVACVPNIGHWSAFAALLAGQWPYADQGLFDRTHVRFFTRSSLHAMFQSAGLHVTDLKVRQKMPPKDAQFVPAVLQLAQALNIKNPALETELTTLQWLIRGTAEVVKPLIIHSKPHRPLGGMSDVRIELPLKALITEPGVRLGHIGQDLRELKSTPEQDTLFIWQRPLSTPQSRAVVTRYKDNGVASIIEFDDEPSLWPANVEDAYKVFSLAAGTQTTTAAMQVRFEGLGAQVGAFDNGIFELPEPPAQTPRGPNSRVNIFFGALNREADWSPYMATLNQILNQYDDIIHVEVIHDEAFFNALNTVNKRFTPTCDYANFHAKLHSSDIAWLPLEDTPKNRLKSDLKFIEAASHGVAVLASPIVYEATVKHGNTGLIYHTKQAFAQYLEQLIQQPNLRLALGTGAREYVAGYRMLAYHNRARLAWYRKCVTRIAQTH